jgi:5,10-methylenetetrahydromethanopterin reductase
VTTSTTSRGHDVEGRADTRRLGAYLLPGRAADPTVAIQQARAGEEAGIGSVWLSERFGSKDVATIGGALTQATRSVTIGAATTHFQPRHPMATASMALTLQALSGGRFVLGVGRSIPLIWQSYGLPPATNRLLADGLDIVRRLWAGETVSYSGPLGEFPRMHLVDKPDVAPPPVVLAAIGPKSLALAGRLFDGVLLHPFLTLEGQARSVEIARNAAAEAGRDPASVRIYGMVVIAPDCTPEQVDTRVRARAVTYFNAPGLAQQLVSMNGWDNAYLEKLAAHPLVVALRGRPVDGALDPPKLIELSRLLPSDWFTEGAAVGTAAECADRLHQYLDAGADEIVIHGSTADLLVPVLAAFHHGS